ncbi:MAG: RsmG family class I SAM-dependent methyltransferase [Acidimicrobiales bacterium]
MTWPLAADAGDDPRLLSVLDRARSLGFLGPGPIRAHVDHAQRYHDPVVAAGVDGAVRMADLGAGGGVPSLPLLVAEPGIEATLVDASARRCSFLVWAAVELGLGDRVEVWRGRAETFGHEAARRGGFDAVVARGFGPPAGTVECGAPLLRLGGRLVISEPPGGRDWPSLAEVGLTVDRSPEGVVVLVRDGEVPGELPRSTARQRRRPLFTL